jgi:hypothetical protein
MAYEAAGGDRRDYDNMHVTDMKDNVHEGEISAIVPPAFSDSVRQAQSVVAGQPLVAPVRTQVNPYAGMSAGDPHRKSGVTMMGKIQQRYPMERAQLQKAGEVPGGRYMGGN